MTDSHVPAATTPVQLRPVDRYDLSDAILAAWHKHGNNSWCSIADEVIAALAAPQQGAPNDDELLATYKKATQEYWDSPDEQETILSEMVLRGLRAVLARYGAQAVPVPVAERLPGEGDCDTESRCWCYSPEDQIEGKLVFNARWHKGRIADHDTHWLPHWALPLPEAQP